MTRHPRRLSPRPSTQAVYLHPAAKYRRLTPRLSQEQKGLDERARAESFRNQWAEREPQAVAAFLSDFEQTLCYLSVEFPRAHVSLIRTTNLLERFHKEIRRKQRDVGMMQSEAGCDVLWYMVAVRETAKQRAACRGKG